MAIFGRVGKVLIIEVTYLLNKDKNNAFSLLILLDIRPRCGLLTDKGI